MNSPNDDEFTSMVLRTSGVLPREDSTNLTE
jgi:hypothetical protein